MKMKVLTRTLSLLSIASLTLFFANCGGDDNPKPKEEVQLGKLSQTWEISEVTLDGVDRIADFTNFTLEMEGTFDSDQPEGPYTFSVGGSRPTPSPWPANGNWFFGPDPESQLIRDEDDDGTLDVDDLGITYSIASSGELTLTFECDGCNYPGARTRQVDGIWEFVLTPQ
jgi:hypothetical protein